MFTKEEAGSFIAAERLMQRFGDETFKKHFQSAIYKIKAVLRSTEKDWLEALESKVKVSLRDVPLKSPPPEVLNILFNSIAEKKQVKMLYHSVESEKPKSRHIEPVTLYHEYEHWYLGAYCHLRKEYRNFRTDRIIDIESTDLPFTLEHVNPDIFLKPAQPENADAQTIRILIDRKAVRYIDSQRRFFGFVSDKAIGDKVEMTFHTHFKTNGMARWFLTFADYAEIIESSDFKVEVKRLIEKINQKLKD